MTTIPDTVENICKKIQTVFEELIKLLIRKTVNPVTNNLGQNRIVYNLNTCRYERGHVGKSSGDKINKYSYQITKDSLGWTDEIFANFKMTAKIIKSNTVKRFPASTKNHNIAKQNSKIVFVGSGSNTGSKLNSRSKSYSSINRTKILNQYNDFIKNITSRNIGNILSNNNGAYIYVTSIPYSKSFRKLESIGKDIINQSDSSIPLHDSMKMSTSQLRLELHELENMLANFSVEYPDIYDSYVEMIRIINSVPKNKINRVANLIATLEYVRWEDVSPRIQSLYINSLGEEFIDMLMSNILVTVLLQSNSSQLIFSASYLYPLLKMLFVVFGYSRLVPVVPDVGCDKNRYVAKTKNKIQKYQNAIMRKDNITFKNDDKFNDYSMYDTASESVSERNDENNVNNTNYLEDLNGSVEFVNRKPDPEPFDQSIYDFIKIFGNFYPTIIGLMGGTEEFPPEHIEVECNNIPDNYDCLKTLSTCLWRYNDFSYCRYLEYKRSKQIDRAVNFKINEKVKYLTSI